VTLLYRAAPEREPYFGKGSYWTASVEFAERFAAWANSEPRLKHLGVHVIYQAEVDLAELLEYDEPMSPAIIDACADLLAEEHQWVAFRERGSSDGLDRVFASLVASCRQYVYLGGVPIRAERNDPARRR
jgi:hypothetical protein